MNKIQLFQPPKPWRVEELSDEFFLRTNHKYMIRSANDQIVAKIEGMGEIPKSTVHAICDAINAKQEIEKELNP